MKLEIIIAEKMKNSTHTLMHHEDNIHTNMQVLSLLACSNLIFVLYYISPMRVCVPCRLDK